jgi:hypothetical protein
VEKGSLWLEKASTQFFKGFGIKTASGIVI